VGAGTKMNVKVTIAPANKAGEQLSVGRPQDHVI
jgi:hypothetical protein